MQILAFNFPSVISDNDSMYISYLLGIIDSVDELSHLEIIYSPKGYSFRISPSLPKYNNSLIKEIIDFNNLFHIKVDFSKSIKTTGTLSFNINL